MVEHHDTNRSAASEGLSRNVHRILSWEGVDDFDGQSFAARWQALMLEDDDNARADAMGSADDGHCLPFQAGACRP